MPYLKKINLSDYLSNWSFLRRPSDQGRFKQSTGKLYSTDGFLHDWREVYRKWNNVRLRQQAFVNVLNGIVDNPEIPQRWWDGREEIGKDEDLLPIDAISRAIMAQGDFDRGLVAGIDHLGMVDEAMSQALRSFLASGSPEKLGETVERGRILVVPKEVTKALRHENSGAPKWVRLWIDKPTKYWITSVLSLRPAWVVNNVVTNAIANTIAGVMPWDYVRAGQQKWIARTPEDFRVTSMNFQMNEQQPNMGMAADSDLGRFYHWLDTKTPVAWIDNVADHARHFNMAIEEYFRRATYISQVAKLARKKYLNRTGDAFYKAYDLLREMDRMSPGEVEKVVGAVNYWMNDYSALNPFERQFVRRLIPFYSFAKYQFMLMNSLPVKYPGRALMMASMAKMGREAQQEDEKNLPEYLQGKGLLKTGAQIKVGDHQYGVWVSTQGWNPFILGGLSQAGEIKDLGNLENMLAAQAGPIPGYITTALRRTNGQGANFTEPGTVEVDGKFYREMKDMRGYGGKVVKWHPEAGVAEVEPPIPNPAEYYFGSFPQVQLARRMVNPHSGFTAEPFSVEGARNPNSATERTRLTELLRYFTGASFVLVDDQHGQALPISRSTLRSILRRMAEQEVTRKDKP